MFETILNNEYYLLQPRLQDPQNFPETIDRAIRSALGKVAFLCQNSLCDTNTSFGLLTEVVGRISAKA